MSESVTAPVSLASPAPASPDQAGQVTAGCGAGEQVFDERRRALPGFRWRAQVFFDELDAMGMLHNTRYVVLLERASSAFFEANGWRWERDPALNPDQHYVVREQTIRYLEPVRGPGELCVVMWAARLGETSVTFGFEVRSGDGRRLHATAERVHVKLDMAACRPVPWTPGLRAQLAELTRPAGPASRPGARLMRATPGPAHGRSARA